MTGDERLVLDTNVIISGLLFEGSVPARALLKAQDGRILISEATSNELIEVLSRSRFDRYVEWGIRQSAAAQYIKSCEMVEIPSPIRAIRAMTNSWNWRSMAVPTSLSAVTMIW